MGEHTNAGGVAGNSAEVLDERRGLLLNRVAQFDLAVIAMYLVTDAIAGGHIDGRCRADLLSRKCLPLRPALHYRNSFTGAKTKLRVKAERAVMEAGLMEPYARNILLCGAVDNVLHQLPPDAAILYRWINGNRSDTVDT